LLVKAGDTVFKVGLFAALLFGATWALAGEPVAVATIVAGKAFAIRGLAKIEVSEGTRLQADDLVHTGNNTYAQIEYADQTLVAMGQDSWLQLNHPARRRGESPALYLLSGWIKVSSNVAVAGKPTSPSFATPRAQVYGIEGTVVAHAKDVSTDIFVERGKSQWFDRRARSGVTPSLKSGDFLAIGQDRTPSVLTRPTKDFVDSLPPLFREYLPPGYAKYQSRQNPPRPLGPFSYDEVQPWIDAEPAVRRQFVFLWRTKINDVSFRAAVERSLALHPEWRPLLFPEAEEARVAQPTPAAPTVKVAPMSDDGPTRQTLPAAHEQ
jgi:hypothetical protein